jgi:hypothetical protein
MDARTVRARALGLVQALIPGLESGLSNPCLAMLAAASEDAHRTAITLLLAPPLPSTSRRSSRRPLCQTCSRHVVHPHMRSPHQCKPEQCHSLKAYICSILAPQKTSHPRAFQAQLGTPITFLEVSTQKRLPDQRKTERKGGDEESSHRI